MTGQVLLVRHTEVARQWHGRCYGRTDVGLSRAGKLAARALVESWVEPTVDAIVHSGSRRAAILALWLGKRIGVVPMIDVNWQERDFGDWEGRSWTAIWRATGSAMDGMLTHPDSFRPGGGETTTEMIDRAARAWASLPAGCVIVVTHAGPIAAVRSVQAGSPPAAIVDYIPPLGSITPLPHRLD